ncbi:hypothetical protein [Deinococcus humi]|uniref:Uncharacterized protein n=1 Tax=Deinococcus humi TaxID=662880 RepID=A0A7W8JQI8_9DEIO|nr:hypothetical protein [Deinococcus humi]MBB5361356.1 hypothetical protein [Deinococcus humi]GGO19624.1 hypothetical protein GCM10008949_04180 [Deinococcus humi]
MKPGLERRILTAVHSEGCVSLERLYTRHLTETGRRALLSALARLEAGGHLSLETRTEPNGTRSRYWRPAE